MIIKVRCCEYSWLTFGNILVEKISSSEMLNQVYGFKNVIGNMEKNTCVCFTESLCYMTELIQHRKSTNYTPKTYIKKNVTVVFNYSLKNLKKCTNSLYINDGVCINLNLSNSEYHKII